MASAFFVAPAFFLYRMSRTSSAESLARAAICSADCLRPLSLCMMFSMLVWRAYFISKYSIVWVSVESASEYPPRVRLWSHHQLAVVLSHRHRNLIQRLHRFIGLGGQLLLLLRPQGTIFWRQLTRQKALDHARVTLRQDHLSCEIW